MYFAKKNVGLSQHSNRARVDVFSWFTNLQNCLVRVRICDMKTVPYAVVYCFTVALCCYTCEFFWMNKIPVKNYCIINPARVR